jgi:hypothetical protein
MTQEVADRSFVALFPLITFSIWTINTASILFLANFCPLWRCVAAKHPVFPLVHCSGSSHRNPPSSPFHDGDNLHGAPPCGPRTPAVHCQNLGSSSNTASGQSRSLTGSFEDKRLLIFTNELIYGVWFAHRRGGCWQGKIGLYYYI